MVDTNPTSDCGQDPACSGGESCSHCDDGMPPAFLLNGQFDDGSCTNCANIDGTVLPQIASSPCRFSGVVDVCSTNPGQEVEFSSTEIKATLNDGLSASVIYLRSRSAGDACNAVHTLTRSSGTGTGCTFPESITITPCDADGNVAPACNENVVTGCCENPVPKSLTATISADPNAPGCECAEGEIPLTYDQSENAWVGSGDYGCEVGGTIGLRVYCDGTTIADWKIDIDGCNPDYASTSLSVSSCQPFNGDVHLLDWQDKTNGRDCCDTANVGADLIITVTE